MKQISRIRSHMLKSGVVIIVIPICNAHHERTLGHKTVGI